MTIENSILPKLHAAAQSARARWTPGKTRMTGLRIEEAKYFLGGVMAPEEPPLEEMETVGRDLHVHAAALRAAVNRVRGQALGAPAAPAIPTEVDWRARGGSNFVTSVKFQGACGTCTCFSTCAAVECAICITTRTSPQIVGGVEVPDLSEAQMFYCGAASQGRTCASGWFMPAAVSYFEATGVAPDSFFPYTSGDQTCSIKPGWEQAVTKITASTKLATPDDMKNWIANNGPLAIMMVAYDDLFTYTGGVYHPVSTNKLGAHSVCIVGYSESKEAWLCKNSWSTEWGEQGYFWMAYGTCGVGSSVYGFNGLALIDGKPVS